MVCWAGTNHCRTAWLRAHYCLAVGIFAGGTKHRTRTYSCGPRIRYGCDSLEPTGRRTAYRTVSTRKQFEWRWTTAGYERTSGIFSAPEVHYPYYFFTGREFRDMVSGKTNVRRTEELRAA